MSENSPNLDPSMSYKAKRGLVETGLMALGTAFEIISKHSPDMKRELESWDGDLTFSFSVLPQGPTAALRKRGDRIEYLGRDDQEAALRLRIKNMDSAVLLLTGMCSQHMAFAERRVLVHGPIDASMQVSRALAVVERFLFPGFMHAKLAKRVPKLSRAELLLKARLYATLGPALIGHLVRN